MVDVVGIGVAERLLGRQREALGLSLLQPQQALLEARCQAAVAHPQAGRFAVQRSAVGHRAVFQLDGEVEQHAAVSAYGLAHAASFCFSERKPSSTIMAAPMKMKLSARLNAGQWERCQ
ncbi:hypothetical protein D3C72_1658450 [compost metagenome]